MFTKGQYLVAFWACKLLGKIVYGFAIGAGIAVGFKLWG